MRFRFTKMQGAGNDFVVLDATRAPLALDDGADAGAWPTGASASAPTRSWSSRRRASAGRRLRLPHLQRRQRRRGRAMRQRRALLRPLSCATRASRDKTTLAVETMNRRLELRAAAPTAASRSTWARPISIPRACRSTPPGSRRAPPRAACRSGRSSSARAAASRWRCCRWATRTRCRASTTSTPRRSPTQGPLIETHVALPAQRQRRLHAGRRRATPIRLRVYERGAGETLACGTGACAAVVAGIRLGLLDARVDVQTRGGRADDRVARRRGAPVLMTGPAETVFEGEIEL